MTASAREYWTAAPFSGEVRHTELPVPAEGEALIRTLVSGISRGTETVVHRGEVPDSVTQLMQAPNQLGELPFPISHGYLNVGMVEQGPEDLLGRQVFTLSGHRSHVTVPAADCHPLPEGMPAERALLAGLAEVGLNAIWEAQVPLAARTAVVGAGPVGLCTALLLDGLSPERLQVVDVDPARRRLIAGLGLDARPPEEAEEGNDLVFHTSATETGLTRALEITGDDSAVVELSWYGENAPRVPLGADFHARRLRIIAAQVGEIAQPMRHRRTRRERLGSALNLLDHRFDALITGRSPLGQLPQVMDELARGDEARRHEMLHVVTYEEMS